MPQTGTVCSLEVRTGTAAHSALAQELDRQAKELAAAPRRLLRALNRNGLKGLDEELRRHGQELHAMAARMALQAPRKAQDARSRRLAA